MVWHGFRYHGDLMVRFLFILAFGSLALVAPAQSVSSGVPPYLAYRQTETQRTGPKQVLPKPVTLALAPAQRSSEPERRGETNRPAVSSLLTASVTTASVSTSDFPTATSGLRPNERLQLKPVKSSVVKVPVLAEIFGNWQVDVNGGLTRALPNPASQLRLGYSDIFETGGDPDKGGHGPSILLRHSFGKKHR